MFRPQRNALPPGPSLRKPSANPQTSGSFRTEPPDSPALRAEYTGGTPDAHRMYTGRSVVPPVCLRCASGVHALGASPARRICRRFTSPPMLPTPNVLGETELDGPLKAGQGCIKLVGLVGTFRRNVRVCAETDASARRPDQRIVELDGPLKAGQLGKFRLAIHGIGWLWCLFKHK